MQLSSVPGNVFIGCFHRVFPGRIAKQRHPFIFHSLRFSLNPSIILPYSRTSSNSDSRGNSCLLFSRPKINHLLSHTKQYPLNSQSWAQTHLNLSFPWPPPAQCEGSPPCSKVLLCCHSPLWGPCISSQPRWFHQGGLEALDSGQLSWRW